jgi:acetylornithine/N-succinyldiaminopimelate aminotransferase
LSATGQPAKRAPFEPAVPGFVHVPFGDARAIEEALGPDVAAVLLEPIQGETGVIVPPPDYLAAVRAACDRSGVLMILDEIQTGLGRTGKWFGADHFGVTADIVCLAKALAGGLPIGACLARAEVAGSFEHGDHASTFGGGPVQCAAALATLAVIEEEGLVDRSAHLGEELKARLEKIVEGDAEVRGLGLMIGIEFDRPIARAITEAAFAAGLLINDATPTTVRLVPPLVIGEDEAERAMDILEGAVHAI